MIPVVAASTAQSLQDNTLLYYKLEEGALNYTDAVGNLNITNGASPANATGIIDAGTNFTAASSQRVWTDDNVIFEQSAFTFNTWIYPTQDTASQTVFGTDKSGNYGGCYFLFRGAGSDDIQFLCYTGVSTNNFRIEGGLIVKDVWQMITVAYDGAQIDLYINGTMQALTRNDTGTVGYDAGNHDLTLADYSQKLGNFFDGKIDEFAYFNKSLNQTEIDYLYNSHAPGEDQQYPYVSANQTPQIGTISFNALNGTGDVIAGGVTAFNASLLESIEKLRVTIPVTDPIGVNWSLSSVYFTANGTNACSLGNRQSSMCFEFPNFIEFRNNTVTDYFNASNAAQGDRFNCTVSGTDTSANYICDIDEHYNPNVYKHYPMDFTDVKWQTDTALRVRNNNWWKVDINNSIVPADADLYKLDFRISPDNSSSEPSVPVFAYACNSSYSTGNPETSVNCGFIASKLPDDLGDDGTKFRATFPLSFVQNLSEIDTILISSNAVGVEYYAMKTYALANGGPSIVSYSSNNGVSYTPLSDGYETDMNINWFYNGTGNNVTGFNLVAQFTNDIANTTNSTVAGFTWDLSVPDNTAPIVNIINPTNGEDVGQSLTVNWTTLDPNGDRYLTNITLSNSTNTTVIGLDLIDTVSGQVFDLSDWGYGTYDLDVESCENETGTPLCGNSNISITAGNSIPSISWTNSTPLIVTMAPVDVNWTCTDNDATDTLTSYLFINNTNLTQPNQTGGTGYSFNLSQTTYNLSVRCDDGKVNSTMVTLILTYTQQTIATFVQPVNGVSYLVENAILNFQYNSVNTPDNITYRLNDFQNVTLTNVTSGANNVTFLDGFNEWRVCFHIAGADECETVRFWVQKSNRGIGDYLPILIWILMIVLIFAAAEMIGMPILQMFCAICVIVFGIYWWSFFTTWTIPVIVTVIGLTLLLRSVFNPLT